MNGNDILRETYLRLRNSEGDKSKTQHLESDLSRLILETEEQMLAAKSDQSQRLIYAKRRARLKRIADGLAWKRLGFDEIRLLSYAGNPTPGLMAGKSGYYHERLVVENSASSSGVGFAIQNDITNILRVGDVTLLLSNNTIEVIEVKSGSEGPGLARAARQEERAKTIHTYLQTGTSRSLAGESFDEIRHVHSQDSPSYYWKRLERVCIEARSRGVAWKQLDASVVVMCYRSHLLPRLQPLIQTALASAGWTAAAADVRADIRLGVLSRHFDHKEKDSAPVRYIIPVTAFEVDSEVISSILVGELDVLVMLNRSAVIAAIKREGLEVEYTDGQVTINTEEAQLVLSERAWNWVVYGLRTVSTLIKSIQTTLLVASEIANRREAP